MKHFPSDIAFRFPWRKYQKRVLDELKSHLNDRHLHVVAPPGSGKTILGLEVVRRLNKPVLIVSPTIAIRNQWIQRFCELFMQSETIPEWISRDVRNPGFMTFVTYQGLHSACNNNFSEQESDEEEEVEESVSEKYSKENYETLIANFKMAGIGVVVVDEAHHLKNEWWQTLAGIKDRLDPVIVGLTATPPYDVSSLEWKRYQELNGPVDTEISVPELVIEGDLCPHQDYVYFSMPTQAESNRLSDFRMHIEKAFMEIKNDEELINALENAGFWKEPDKHLEWIYENVHFYSSCLIFLHANKREISELHLEITGNRKLSIPDFDYDWMEILLDFYLLKEKNIFKARELHQEMIEHRLKRIGAIENKRISFKNNLKITGALSISVSKLDSIRSVVDLEHGELGSSMRMVILTDYIRKEFIVSTPDNDLVLDKLGVIPVFEKLRRENERGLKLGVLTGSVVILPLEAYAELQDMARGKGIEELSVMPLSYDGAYVMIRQNERLKHMIVHSVTEIFQNGSIEVLIGTKSLLGEGWDAPAINALVLASFVGSFVSSNQMRGRAIRTQRGNKDKTGNIWHLVCIDPTAEYGGNDMDALRRRFSGFVGLSHNDQNLIENNVERLELKFDQYDTDEMQKMNLVMSERALDRAGLRWKWEQGLKNGVRQVEMVRIDPVEKTEYHKIRVFYFNKTLKNFGATLASGVSIYIEDFLEFLLRNIRHIRSFETFIPVLWVFSGLGVVLFGGRTFKAVRLYLKYRDITKDIRRIGEVVLSSLIRAGAIGTEGQTYAVETSLDNTGSVYCNLSGGTSMERSLFLDVLLECIGPIDSPKYVLIRKSRSAVFFTKKDYHSVPEIIGKNKRSAEFFKDKWEELVGDCELIYTRNIQGRKWLLKSRLESLASQLDDEAERVNKWK